MTRLPGTFAAPRRLVVWLVLTAVIGSCGPRPTPLSSVVLISIDTLRPDRLGAYGGPEDNSPFLDAWARKALLFEDASSHAPSTTPSHASILTGLLPQHHGVSHAQRRALSPENPTLTTHLRRAGYRTAAFVGGGQLSPETGLLKDFEEVRVTPRALDRFENAVDLGLDWIDGLSGSAPWFVFLHSFEVHRPFDAPEADVSRAVPAYDGPLPRDPDQGLRVLEKAGRPIPEDYLAYVVGHYDAQVSSMDRGFGQLIEGLRDRGLLESTLVIFTSDHGETLGEDGTAGQHAHSLREELLRIPLIVDFPGSGPRAARISAPVRSIDLLPTILDELGLRPPPLLDGRSLKTVLPTPGKADDLPVIAYRDTATPKPRQSIRLGRWKLEEGRLFSIDTGREKLEVDQPEVKEQLRDALRRDLVRIPPLDTVPFDHQPKTVEALRSLGYIQ